MTKLFSIFAVAILATTFVSCGPSAEEKAKMEEAAKHAGDSIAAALSESLNTTVAEATDSTAAPAETAPAAEAAPATEAKH